VRHVARIDFDDLDSQQPGFVLARAKPGLVEMTLKLEPHDGVAILVTADDARAIAAALEAAASTTGS
jgi:hypothetical protein